MSCTTWGFSCPGACAPGGGLLPRLFTLTGLRARRRTAVLFSVTLSVVPGLGRGRPRVVRGMAPCGVRTFLPAAKSATGRSSALRKGENTLGAERQQGERRVYRVLRCFQWFKGGASPETRRVRKAFGYFSAPKVPDSTAQPNGLGGSQSQTRSVGPGFTLIPDGASSTNRSLSGRTLIRLHTPARWAGLWNFAPMALAKDGQTALN